MNCWGLLGFAEASKSFEIVQNWWEIFGVLGKQLRRYLSCSLVFMSTIYSLIFLGKKSWQHLASGLRTLHNSTHWSMIIFANSSPPIGQFGAIKTTDWVVECKYELSFKIMVTISQDNPLVPANTAHPSQYCQQSTQVFSQRSGRSVSLRLCSQRCLSRHSIWLPVNV